MSPREENTKKRKKISSSPIIAQEEKSDIALIEKMATEGAGGDNISDSTSGGEMSYFGIILASLNKLHDKFDSQKKEHDNLSKEIFGESGIEPRVTQAEAQCDDNTSEITDIKGKYDALKKEHTLLLGIVKKQSAQIDVLSNKVEDLVVRSMKDNIIISGLKEEDAENSDLEKNVFDFFENNMTINPKFDTMHRIGEKREGKGPRPVVAKCASIREKSKIFQNVRKLKDKKNEAGKPYFISDQYPDGVNERRRKFNSMIKENKDRPTTEQLAMKIQRNQLFINNEMYKPVVVPPSVDDLFDIQKSEEEKMNKLSLVYGDIQSERGSTFYGAAVKVQSVADIRRAYKKVVMLDPSATHVMAAFKYKSPQGRIMCDYVDDGEHGGSWHVMQNILDGNYIGVACFVVRHYGGTHLGVRRFNHINTAASSALYKLYNR